MFQVQNLQGVDILDVLSIRGETTVALSEDFLRTGVAFESDAYVDLPERSLEAGH